MKPQGCTCGGVDVQTPLADGTGQHAVNCPVRTGWQAWAALTAADSLLSLVVHRYKSLLPESLIPDMEATYLDCRRIASEMKSALTATEGED